VRRLVASWPNTEDTSGDEPRCAAHDWGIAPPLVPRPVLLGSDFGPLDNALHGGGTLWQALARVTPQRSGGPAESLRPDLIRESKAKRAACVIASGRSCAPASAAWSMPDGREASRPVRSVPFEPWVLDKALFRKRHHGSIGVSPKMDVPPHSDKGQWVLLQTRDLPHVSFRTVDEAITDFHIGGPERCAGSPLGAVTFKPAQDDGDYCRWSHPGALSATRAHDTAQGGPHSQPGRLRRWRRQERPL
jgi:hypothetical protein